MARRRLITTTWIAALAASAIAVVHAPAAGAAAPTITVTPSSGLGANQVVSATATGLTPNGSVLVVQCVVADPSPQDCGYASGPPLTTDGGGAVTTPFTAQAVIVQAATGSFIDCRIVACEIAVIDEAQAAVIAAWTPITFAPGGPTPAITVTPASGLATYQTVHLHGSGFLPGDWQFPLQCPSTLSIVNCHSVGWSSLPVAADGTIDLDINVQALLPTGGGSPIDCSQVQCYVTSLGGVVLADSAWTPISFVSGGPVPTITPSPSTLLPYKTTIAVTGTHFAVGGLVDLVECGTGPQLSGCDTVARSRPRVASDGTISAPISVHRVLDVGPGLDCTAAGTTCTIEATDTRTGLHTAAGISFDPNAPVPPPPAFQFSATASLQDRQPVRVTAQNLTPGAAFGISLCGSGSVSVCNSPDPVTPSTVDANGRIDVTLIAHRYLSWYHGAPTVDCAALPGSYCWIRVDVRADKVSLMQRVFFGSGRAPRAHASVTPNTGLADGQLVRFEVRSAGYGATAKQCALGPSGAPLGCLSTLPLVGDPTGHVRQGLTVARFVPDATGGPSLDCRIVSCAVVIAPDVASVDALRVPLTFA